VCQIITSEILTIVAGLEVTEALPCAVPLLGGQSSSSTAGNGPEDWHYIKLLTPDDFLKYD
jgi:hypothetical protein